MSGALQIGPLALPLSLLVLVGAAACALWVGGRLGRKDHAVESNREQNKNH